MMVGIAVTPGLSPRVRGNLAGRPGAHRPEGSIPACAGEPRRDLAKTKSRAVYPRVCGGTLDMAITPVGGRGLSPRVRGNQNDGTGGGARPRSIPACAGEPSEPAASPGTSGVYPRVCGGTGLAATTRSNWLGLSPRVRGNPYTAGPGLPWGGSIPACAGEPFPAVRSEAPTRVYPRVCGGTERPGEPGHRVTGLSPRVRGNRERRTGRCG